MASYPQYPAAPARVRFDTIGEAWGAFQQQMGPWVATILIFFVIVGGTRVVTSLIFVGSIAVPGLGPAMPALTGGQIFGLMVVSLIQWVVSSALMGGAFYMAITQIRGGTISPADLFSRISLTPRMMGATFLMGLAVAVGAVFCIIPGFIVIGLLMLTVPLIVDKDLGAVEALTESWNALKTDWLNATVYYFVIAIVAAIGLLACGVGVLFTYPLYFLGIAGVYRDFFLAEPPSPGPMEPFHYTQQPPPTPPPPPAPEGPA